MLGFIGTLCFGICCEDPAKYPWILPMVMTAFQFLAVMGVNVVTATYAIECFPDLAAPMVIIVGAYRNIVGFGLTYSVNSFIDAAGYAGCFGTYAGVLAFLCLLGIPLYIRGGWLRERLNTWPIRHDRSAKLE
jgi:hypothetical protein